MKKLITLLLLILSITAFGQSDTETVDERLFQADTMSDGAYISRYPNGNILYMGQIEDGQKVGVWKYYYSHGALKEVITYVNGVKYGISRKLDPYGVVVNESNFFKGVLNGPYHEFYENESLALKGHYKDGLKDSIWIEYSPEGDALFFKNYNN